MNGSYNVIELDKFKGSLVTSSRNFRNCDSGEILIKVFCTTVHVTDLLFLNGGYGIKPDIFPIVPGFEGSGEIVQVGESVDTNLIGKRSTFVCSLGKNGIFEGGWAQFVYVSKYAIIPFESKNINYENIAFSFINPLTVCGFLDTVQKKNVTAVVQNGAAGAVGKMFIRLCAKHGIKSINLVRKQEQIEELKKLGANFVISTSSKEWEAELSKLALENNALVGFDSVGGEMTGKMLSLMPNRSTLYHFGNMEDKNMSGITSVDLIFKEKNLIGWWLMLWMKTLKPEELIKWTNAVRSDLESDSIIFETQWRKDDYGLNDIDKAIVSYTNNQSLGKVIIRPNSK